MARESISVVSAMFNEAESIANTLSNWANFLDEFAKQKQIDYEIILVDDASTDNSLEVAQEQKLNKMTIIQNGTNLGAGKSLSFAISAAKYKYILVLDSDNQFPISNLNSVWPLRGDNTVVAGRRRSKQAGLSAKLGSKFSNTLFHLLISNKISDSNCAFKLIPRWAFTNTPIRGNRMLYSGEHSYICLRNNLAVENVAVSHVSRRGGLSKTKLLRDGVGRLIFTVFLGLEFYLVKRKLI